MNKIKGLKGLVGGLVFGLAVALTFLKPAQAQESPEVAAKDSITQKALQFLWNTVMRTDSMNYWMFSDSMKNLHRFVGVESPSKYQEWMQPVVRFDSARVLDAVVWTLDTASAYIETFGPKASEI